MVAESMLPSAGIATPGTAAGRAILRRAFMLLWLSDTAFDLGAALMSFALGVWIFQLTGSAAQFSIAVVAAALPGLLLAPLAGALADRFDRRWLIAGCDIASVLMIGTLALLLSQQRLTVTCLYVFNAAAGIVVAVRSPAYSASLGAVVPSDRLTQASGLLGLTQSGLQVGAPLLAGYIMGSAGLEGVVAIEMVLAVAGAVAAFNALSRVGHAIRGMQADARLSLMQATAASFQAALRYFKDAPLMAVLAAYGVLNDSLIALAAAMMTPLVLSTHSSTVLGTILTGGALGGALGSALLLVARVNRRLMLWVLLANAGLALFVMLLGLPIPPPALCACAFLALLCGSAARGCAFALWIRKTPPANRGSILALLGSLGLLMTCVMVLGGGSLGEHLFEPALAAEGAWAQSAIGAWLGTGKGRGLGFLFTACGAASLVISLLALAHGRLRRLDELVFDQPGESSRLRACAQAIAS